LYVPKDKNLNDGMDQDFMYPIKRKGRSNEF